MENTTPHLKSSPSPSFFVLRFAILGHPNSMRAAVADPDLQIRGEWSGGGVGGHPDQTEVRGRLGLKKNLDLPLGNS